MNQETEFKITQQLGSDAKTVAVSTRKKNEDTTQIALIFLGKSCTCKVSPWRASVSASLLAELSSGHKERCATATCLVLRFFLSSVIGISSETSHGITMLRDSHCK